MASHDTATPSFATATPSAATGEVMGQAALQPNFAEIPIELRELPRWVLWRYQPHGTGVGQRVPKAPICSKDGRPASTTNPATWASFDEAQAAYLDGVGKADGLGFVVASGIVGGDLDHCRDPETGDIEAWAKDILDLVDTYSEVSPSGTGVRFFARATLPPKGRKRGAVEMYEGDGGRYLTVTGHRLEDAPSTVMTRQTEVSQAHRRYILDESSDAPKATATSDALDLNTLAAQGRATLERMFNSPKGARLRALYNGDTTAHSGDHSAADLALVSHLDFWSNGSTTVTDALFRRSGLMRPKWDVKHRADGATYGQMTIERARSAPQQRSDDPPASPTGFGSGAADVGASPENHVARGSVTDVVDWGVLQPLPPDSYRVPTLDPDLLPDVIRPWVIDHAKRASLGLDWFVPGVLVGLAATVGNRWRIRPKRNDNWVVTPNLYGLLVLAPAQMKTQALRAMLKPLQELENRARDGRAKEAVVVASRLTRLQHEKAALDRDMVAASRSMSASPVLDELESRLAHVEREIAELCAPDGTVIVNDATVERLLEVLRANPRGVLYFRDELTGWFRDFQKRGRESDRAFFIEAFEGDAPFRQERIGRGTIVVPKLTLSILGGMQPSRLNEFRRGAITGHEADGLLQRFQVLVWPDAMPPYERVDQPPVEGLEARVNNLYRGLFDLDPAHFDTDGVVTFDDDAQEAFFNWFEKLEGRVRAPTMRTTPAWAAFLGKLRSLVPTIALLYHLVDVVISGESPVRVGLGAFVKALSVAEYLEGHAFKVYRPELAPGDHAAVAIAELARKGEIKDMTTVREIERMQRSGLDRANIDSGLQELETRGWLRVEKHDTGGRPTRVVRLRPGAFSEN